VPSTPAGTRSPAEGAAKSPEMLGQATYNAKCGKCHGLKVTTDYTAERWISVMQVMAPKARLDDTEKENVLAYVKANAKKLKSGITFLQFFYFPVHYINQTGGTRARIILPGYPVGN